MPIIERDAWRLQYFERVACPEDVIIPTDDADAYTLHPDHRWVYNKLLICETQDLPCGPHGVEPPRYPVFSKPIYNLRGMGIGSQPITSAAAYQAGLTAGHMWMPLLEGEHLSTDMAVAGGRTLWCRHARGQPLAGGTFDFWAVLGERRPDLEAGLSRWVGRHLSGHTGIVNFETIGGRIIECHLRLSDQWVDLYGPGWMEAVVGLYATGGWRFEDAARRDAYSVVLFAAHDRHYRHPAAALIRELLADPAISSIQITFDPEKPPALHAMPPGGFRLAIVNCWSLEAGLAARARLAAAIPVAAVPPVD